MTEPREPTAKQWKRRALPAEQQAAPKAEPGEPSDAEIDAFLDSPVGITWVIASTRERYRLLVRAILAKWGTQPQAGAVPQGWKAVPVNPTPEMWKAAKSVPDPNPPYPPHYGLVWDAMLAASPTPPAEKQARPGAVYAELPEPDATTVGLGAVWNRHSMRDFADRTHALRASQGQASSQAGEYPALVCDYCGALTPDPWHSSGMLHGKMSKHIHSCDACAAPGVVNSVFDHQTAADFLSGKTVSDEAVRKFVATSRWAHDERAALSAKLLAMHGVLTSREAEIALLKKALLEAETAPQPAPDCHHRPPCNECAALAAQGGKV